VDGLTPYTQGSNQKTWWDSSFTQLLLSEIPLETAQIVELDCGFAAAAHSLLPSLPKGRYLGLDGNPARLAEGKAQLQGAHIAPRVELRLSTPRTIPMPDHSSDVVLSIMSLQHLPDVPTVLAEAQRVLGAKGRFICVEPDNLGQYFYFDGVLEEINRTFHDLCLRARVARQPADIALGPRMPQLLREACFPKIKMKAHLINSIHMEPAYAFFSRLQRVAQTIAREADLESTEPALAACEQAINRSQFAGMPKRLGFSCHAVPVFLSVGRKG
jgi:ubiquinone/menaquinone biosynthesis C-methylase UbiE